MIGLQVLVLLSVIIIGTRLQGIGLGIMGGLGLAIFTFVFHIKPTDPPITLMLIIMSIVIAVSALEVAGGLRYLNNLAEKAIHKYPNRITFLAPLISYCFVLLAGTGHVIYAILPVISTVAREKGVRPERPLAASVIASQQAAISSPISAPMAVMVGLFASRGIELSTILSILIPSTLGGTMLATLVASKMGKELKDEPSYRAYLAAQHTEAPDPKATAPIESFTAAKRALIVFLLGIVTIIFFGICKKYVPTWEVNGVKTSLEMPVITSMSMLSVAAIITLIAKVKATTIVKAGGFASGIQAVISILGIAWLGDTFFLANKAAIIELTQQQLAAHPWQFAIMLFFMSMLLTSHTATLRALMPLGVALGIPPAILLAAAPAANGIFFIPNYPTLLAAVNLDPTGTTKIGKYMLNHSFMLPGLVATISASLIALGLVHYFL